MQPQQGKSGNWAAGAGRMVAGGLVLTEALGSVTRLHPEAGTSEPAGCTFRNSEGSCRGPPATGDDSQNGDPNLATPLDSARLSKLSAPSETCPRAQ